MDVIQVQIASAVASAVSALGSLASALVATRNAAITKQQAALNESSARGRIFMDIAKLWSDIYVSRNAALNAPILTKNQLMQKYGEDFKQFLGSDEWKQLRPLCNFFESVGVMLHQNSIRPSPLFALVTVDVFKEFDGTRKVHVPEGVMYKRLEGPIQYLRHEYRPDLYKYYDQFLLRAYKIHLESGDQNWNDEVERYFAEDGKSSGIGKPRIGRR